MVTHVQKITVSALFLALGLILPMAFHGFGPNVGAMLLPMHIPVLLCGFVCGAYYGAFIGLLTPFLSSLLTGMPILYPVGIAMMFELMIYGCFTGLFIKRYPIYVSLVISMLCGRIVSGIVQFVLLSFVNKAYTLSIFLGASFVSALPGIVLQLCTIPLLINIIHKVLLPHKEY